MGGGDWLRRLSRFELKAIVQKLAEAHGEDAVKAVAQSVASSSTAFAEATAAETAKTSASPAASAAGDDVPGDAATAAAAAARAPAVDQGVPNSATRKRHVRDSDGKQQQESGERAKQGNDMSGKDAKPPSSKKVKTKKNNKAFDMDFFAQRHIALHLAYFGDGYRGFCAQPTVPETVEEHLFRALKKACLITDRASSQYSRCGRTDVGVSALGQVVTLTVRSKLASPLPEASTIPRAKSPPPKKRAKNTDGEPNEEMDAADDTAAKAAASDDANELDYPVVLNRLLPDDIFVLGWAPAPSRDFQARFNCETRTYRYYFMARDLDLEAMQKAANLLVGTHDFRHFCKMDVTNVKNFVRRIEAAEVIKCDGAHGARQMCYLKVCGSAFLWHQIRCLVSVLFLVGQRLESPDVISALLDIEKNPRKPVYDIASELPLILYESEYAASDIDFRYNAEVLSELRQRLELREARHAISASMARGVIEFIDERAPVKDASTAQLVPFKTTDACVPIPSDFPKTIAGKPGRVQKSSSKHVKLFDRPLCDSYEERVGRMSERKLQDIKDKHGWDLASDIGSDRK
ncbi:tRNA pseudouridine synthase [Hondaea fermentalgiana]|uniref:tRNA pseudouridine synthase n=1 Tax=Hondaea fermentalgiana TaxID=2315210 RepID=A0A2R5GGG2_9STRA|nr:tRNA pseudouridine synthase [Hondaea fermentalgiana]|eukprot:GBG29996.1 tRNA pseudouridine synthase [Hondaea fermentalgiana]